MTKSKLKKHIHFFEPFGEEWKFNMMDFEKEEIIFMFSIIGKESEQRKRRITELEKEIFHYKEQSEYYEATIKKLQVQNSRNESL